MVEVKKMFNPLTRCLALLSMLVMPLTSSVAGDKPAVTGAIVIDVRSEAEWNAGHLEGAVLIPHDRIDSGITKVAVDKKSALYLYCRSGRRTAIAADVLKKAGYLNLINLGTMENASRVLGRQIVY